MKSINVYFENEEFEKLSKAKGKQSWHDFIMNLIKKQKKDDKKREIK